MRVTTIFLLLAVVAFHARGDGEADKSSIESDSGSEGEGEGEEDEGIEPDCDQYKQQTCPKKGDPVCGTNKKEYNNECELCLDNRKKNKDVQIFKYGACESE